MRTSRLIFAGLVILAAIACDLGGNRISRGIQSPDGSNRALIFERDCGATTDFSTQVSILPVGKRLPSRGGNIFIADGNHGVVTVDSHGATDVGVGWKNNQQIEITSPPGTRIFLEIPEFYGIRISYKPN